MHWKGRLLHQTERLAGAVSDRAYLGLRFRRRFGRWPAMRHPESFNEHILNYKLSTKGDPRLPRLADKISVKEHVAAVIGSEHVVPTLWHGVKLPPRKQRNWPKPYVIKPSHTCGCIAFVRSDADEDWRQIEGTASEWLSDTYALGLRDREWHYSEIRPRLLVEPMLGDGRAVPPDYKFYVFGGHVEFITVDEGRYQNHRRYTFDREWRAMPFEAGERRGSVDPERPRTLPEMIAIAETLGRDFEFVRVDLYEVSGRPVVGEMTFFPGGGTVRWEPASGDYILGSFWPRPETQAPQATRLSEPAFSLNRAH
jgi:hypothetical protein